AEQSPKNKRAAHVGTAQLAWSVGPMITFALAVLVAPLGLLGSRLIFLHLFIIAGIALYIRRGLPESEVWEEEQRKAKLAKENKIVKPKMASKGSLKDLFAHPATRQAIYLTLGIYLFWNLTAGAMGYFMPYIYENVGGLSICRLTYYRPSCGCLLY